MVSQNRRTDDLNDTVALVLAGGRGMRLRPLTQQRCKPAVPFGGNCRIIDFTLSNCINSGIRRIGVLTQYEQHSLIRHLQTGWNFLQREHNEFIDIMPAQQRYGDNWYQGTADAITQNLEWLKAQLPKHTLILAGDHIYKADYRRMIQHHVANKADVTIACCEVPASDSDQFGIVSLDDFQRIVRFAEKPAYIPGIHGRPTMAQASMGIYLFDTAVLLDCLAKDQHNPQSSHDFGTDIIPSLINTHRVIAHEFDQAQSEAYWRDVGTLDAYYDANMQLLDPVPSLELNNRDWPIHTRLRCTSPAQFAVDSTGHKGQATDSIVGAGCVLRGSRVRHCVIFSDVQIHAQSHLENSLVLPGATIGKRCRIRNTIIDSRACIPDDTDIGYDLHDDARLYSVSDKGIVVVAAGDEITPAPEPAPVCPAPSQANTRQILVD
ncbi:MAG: glucose-1-phosphate adenylyltransferase [Granulosicoccus sp.]